MTRIAARQLAAHVPGPHDGDGIQEGRTKAQIRVLNQQSAMALLVMLGAKEGGQIFHTFVSQHEPDELPTCPIPEVEPEPTAYAGACASQYRQLWQGRMALKLEGLMGAGTYSEIAVSMNSIIVSPPDCNVGNAQWIHYKWRLTLTV